MQLTNSKIQDGLKRTIESYPHLQAQNQRSISKASIFLGNGNRMNISHTHMRACPCLHTLLEIIMNIDLGCSCEDSSLGRHEANNDCTTATGCYLLSFIYMWLHLHYSNGKAFLTNRTVFIHSWDSACKCVWSSVIFPLTEYAYYQLVKHHLGFYPSSVSR